MSTSTKELLDSALHLPPPARAFLAEKLLESLDAEGAFDLSEEWRQEIRRRCDEIDSGLAELIPAEDVFREAYRALG